MTKGRHDGCALGFAPLESETGGELVRYHPTLTSIDSVIWWDHPEPGDAAGRVRVRSDATIQILRYLGGPWALLGGMIAAVPRPWRDAVYDVIAKQRHRIVRGRPCSIPSKEMARRMLP